LQQGAFFGVETLCQLESDVANQLGIDHQEWHTEHDFPHIGNGCRRPSNQQDTGCNAGQVRQQPTQEQAHAAHGYVVHAQHGE